MTTDAKRRKRARYRQTYAARRGRWLGAEGVLAALGERVPEEVVREGRELVPEARTFMAFGRGSRTAFAQGLYDGALLVALKLRDALLLDAADEAEGIGVRLRDAERACDCSRLQVLSRTHTCARFGDRDRERVEAASMESRA